MALRRAHQYVQAQAARMQDPELLAHLLGDVQLHHEIVANSLCSEPMANGDGTLMNADFLVSPAYDLRKSA